MPKITKRRCTIHTLPLTPQASNITARKVSFEDGSHSCPSSPVLKAQHSDSTDSTASLIPRTNNAFRGMTAQMKRHSTPSMSLSELVKVESPSISICSSQSDDSSSLWGQFVDVVPQEEDDYYCYGRNDKGVTPSDHAYQPYHMPKRYSLRKRQSSSFLPGFLLSIPNEPVETSKSTLMNEVEGALKRMSV